MADLPEIVTVGEADHPGLHRAERREVNALRRRAASLEAGRSIGVRGELDTTDQLPAVGEDREGWLVAGHLWAWDTATGSWSERGSVQGPQGDVGPAGPVGPRGVQGVQGVAGATGPQGQQGVKGDTGLTGAPGAGLNIKGNLPATTNLPATGNTAGDSYIIGTHLWVWQTSSASWLDVGVIPQGPAGVAGAQGPQGVPGVKGDKGDPGPAGPEGPQGQQGPAGSAATATTDASKLTTGTLSASRLPVVPETKLPDLSATYTTAALDITRNRPQYMLSIPKLTRLSVMQCPVKEPVSGDLYISQTVAGTTTGVETAVISRVSADGVLRDSMTLTDGGHGTTIALQRINGAVYVWMNYSAGGELVRFKYTAGATMTWATRASFATTIMPRFGGGYVIVAIDEYRDWIAYRDSTSSTETYTRRKLSDVLAGRDVKYGQVVLTQGAQADGSYITMQGFCTVDGDLYRYTGADSDNPDPAKIGRYSWDTGLKTGELATSDLGRNADGTEPVRREPEGLTLWRDPNSHLPHLLAGVTIGPGNSRTYLLYVIAPTGGSTLAGDTLKVLDELTPVNRGYKARRMVYGTTEMRDLNRPGWYYLSETEFAAMTDRPADAVTSSPHYVEVSGWDDLDGRIQKLYRVTSGTQMEWTRWVNSSFRSNWYRTTAASVAYA